MGSVMNAKKQRKLNRCLMSSTRYYLLSGLSIEFIDAELLLEYLTVKLERDLHERTKNRTD